MLGLALLFLLAIVPCLALYDDGSAVFKLTSENFKPQVVNSEEFWLVEFYGTCSLSQLLGVATARRRLLSTCRQQRSLRESSTSGQLTWQQTRVLEPRTMSKDIQLLNSSLGTRRIQLNLTLGTEPSINLLTSACLTSKNKSARGRRNLRKKV